MNNDNINVNEMDYNINNVLDLEISSILNRSKQLERDILVLSGGSSKGIAQIGAIHCLQKHGIIKTIRTIAGTSAGSIVGMMYCAGYQPIEMYKFFSLLDVTSVTKLDAVNMITTFGLNDGKRMVLVLKKLLTAKGFDENIVFKDFYRKTNIKYIVTGTCVNDKQIKYFSYETYPNMKIIDAVRISISIPVFFTPVIFEGKTYVDGACIDNFPIHLFKNEQERVIGIYVTEMRENVEEIKYIDTYLTNVIECIMESMSYREVANYSNIIFIRCTKPGETPADFASMFDQGYMETKNKIDMGVFTQKNKL